ncbi:hypothetical protein ACQPZP_01920 [Spirillospora sp. CA-142024]|uniref:hypothetical protein n=1 Tax=Spirillospora sp. CA-142024 TaxID=3240036 RepID=UPI003D8F38AD
MPDGITTKEKPEMLYTAYLVALSAFSAGWLTKINKAACVMAVAAILFQLSLVGNPWGVIIATPLAFVAGWLAKKHKAICIAVVVLILVVLHLARIPLILLIVAALMFPAGWLALKGSTRLALKFPKSRLAKNDTVAYIVTGLLAAAVLLPRL